jgi:hypothetical protein
LPKPQSCLYESACARGLLLLLLVHGQRSAAASTGCCGGSPEVEEQARYSAHDIRIEPRQKQVRCSSQLASSLCHCPAHRGRICNQLSMRSIRTISEERSGIGGGLLSAYLHEHSPQFTRIWTRGFSSAENCGTLDTESTRDGAVASPPVPTTAIRPRIVDMASCSLPRRRCDLERIPRGIDLQTQIALAFRACSLSRLLSSGIKQFEENKSSFHLPSIPTDLHPVPQHTPLITPVDVVLDGELMDADHRKSTGQITGSFLSDFPQRSKSAGPCSTSRFLAPRSPQGVQNTLNHPPSCHVCP